MADHSILSVDEWLKAQTTNLSASAGERMPVVATARMVGPLRSQAIQTSKLLQAAPTDEEKLRIFITAIADGISTILNIARKRSGYDPTNTKDPDLKLKFDRYISDVQSAPFFTLTLAQTTEVHRSSTDWNELLDAIADTFEGIAAEDKKNVVKGLASLAKTAASSESFRQTEDLFVQSVMKAQTGDWSIYLYRSRVELQADKSKGVSSRQTDFSIQKLKLRFLDSQWPTWAERIFRKFVVDPAAEWEDRETTPSGNLSSNLCIGKSQSA
jgi:hypothetical protein